MFRAAAEAALPLVAAASSRLFVTISLPTKLKPARCEEKDTRPLEASPRASSDEDGNGTASPFRVLVVGSGLTGCLAALRIRQRLSQANRRPDPCQGAVDLTVVERATYSAGRFGAAATYGGVEADLGAQVLSTLNPLDSRARGGHGVTVPDIRLAWGIAQALRSSGVIARADDRALGETEERMLWEGLWEHYFATSGMSGVLRQLLGWAGAKPRFGVRVDALEVCQDRRVRVRGMARSNISGHRGEDFDEFYDCVVLCIPAPNVLELGVAKYLSPLSRHVLDKVRYDERVCEAHFFSEKLLPNLTEAFGDRAELMVDAEGCNSKIQYITLQSQKKTHPALSPVGAGPCALVVHGRVGQMEPLSEALDAALGVLLGATAAEVTSHRRHVKSIAWRVSQLVKPMEAVVADPPTPAWQCITGVGGGIVIAGDFMTQSSFLGCVASADAAARAVVENIRKSSQTPSAGCSGIAS